MTGKAENARPAGHELLITRSFDAPWEDGRDQQGGP
jgi:hypothetical protein